MLVALEGIDGSGKGTQTRLLQQRAIEAGITTTHISFPQYGSNAFAQVVSEYLNGAYGEVGDVHPKLTSLLFAGDRFASKGILNDALQSNALVICDRYVSSNLAHQAAKLPEPERRAFIEWLYAIEFDVYGLPKPDLSVYLDVPVKTAQKLISQKPNRDQFALFAENAASSPGAYTSLRADIHEKNEFYLSSCVRTYKYLISNNIAGPWESISCLTDDGKSLLSAEAVSEKVWEIVGADLLPTKNSAASDLGHAVS